MPRRPLALSTQVERALGGSEAVAELDALAPLPAAPAAEASPADGGVLSGMLLVVLAPVFLAWELVTGSVRATLALADGVALRLRTGARALLWTVRATVTLLGRTLRRWADLRRRVAAAAAEARGRFLAARLRVRLRLRGLRHPGLSCGRGWRGAGSRDPVPRSGGSRCSTRPSSCTAAGHGRIRPVPVRALLVSGCRSAAVASQLGLATESTEHAVNRRHAPFCRCSPPPMLRATLLAMASVA